MEDKIMDAEPQENNEPETVFLPGKSAFTRFISQPLSSRGVPRWLVFALAITGLIYLLNPTAGFIELLPDNIPFLGNLDEGAAFALVLAGLVELFEGKKSN